MWLEYRTLNVTIFAHASPPLVTFSIAPHRHGRLRTMRTTMPDDLTITTRRRIDDAGEKIGGARKDAWAQRGLATSDLAEMTPEEARQHVTKDAIWPKPDWSAMVADGLDPPAAALLKIVRARLGATPALHRSAAHTSELPSLQRTS